MSINEIATPIPRRIDAAPKWKNFAKNTVNPIVTNWFNIVVKEYEIDFSCALKICCNNALIATGIINNNTAKKYLNGTWNSVYIPSLNRSDKPNISVMFMVKIVTSVVKYFGKSSSNW